MTNGYVSIVSIPDLNEHHSAWYGLTKREYFAAMAMQGLLNDREYSINVSPAELSKAALQYTDALINELNK